MQVLVTGGRGFVGSYVVQELRNYNHEVIILSNLSHPSQNTQGWRYVYGDVRYDYDLFKVAKRVDAIIHLAAKINVDRSREYPKPFFDINILGTFNVLEACRRFGCKLVHASTSEVLGCMKPEYSTEHGMSESYPFMPDNPYGATKAAADQLVLGWIKSYGIKANILRSFNITGIGQAYDKEGAFIPKTIHSIIDDKDPIIFGNGDQTRDYIWAGDVARAYRMLLESELTGEVFHAGTSTETSIKEIAEKLIKHSKKKLKINYIDPRPNEIKRLKCDYRKIKNKLGWQPTRKVEEVLFEMYDRCLLEVMK